MLFKDLALKKLNNLFQHDNQIVLEPSGNKTVRTQNTEIFHVRVKFLHSEKVLARSQHCWCTVRAQTGT